MIEIDARNEVISIVEANKILDSSQYATISDCNIIGDGYISNITSLVRIIGVNGEGAIFVLRDDAQSVISNSFVNGVRPVSVVCGYAYSHQIKRDRSYGC